MVRILARLVKWLVALALVAAVLTAGWLYFVPPALIRVGTGYSAKIVCSNVFLAGRDAAEILAVDVQAPGHPLLRLISLDVDRTQGVVSAALLGIFGRNTAIYRGEALGCASVPDGDIAAARAVAPMPTTPTERGTGQWPDGEEAGDAVLPAVEAVLDDPELTGPGMRAVVVVHDGRIVGERYGEGFSAETPLLGWSMTKTVTAAIVGTMVRDGRLALNQATLLPNWSGDDRARIRLSDMMAMSSGLAFNESYGDVADVTRMLFLEADMAGFAAGSPLAGGVGEAFNYSSGTSVMLSRIWQDAAGEEALARPREALFAPLGMKSAVMEADAAGTFVGSSYLYATARDWARFGQFLLQDGVWNGVEILPAGYVDWMREKAPASNGLYGRGHLWYAGPGEGGGLPLPGDTYWARGHDGQSMAMVPSRRLVVVRLGLTPSGLGYSPQPMVAALARAVE